jgi:uncharacterized protein YqeY
MLRSKLLGTELVKEAMLSKNKVRLSVVRQLKSEVVRIEGGLKEMSETEIIGLVKKSIESLKLTKSDGWEKEVAELETFMPKMMSEDEMSSELDNFLSENENVNIGLIMKHFSTNFEPGTVDRKVLSGMVKVKLG